MSGWVKLHENIINNEIWRKDRTAWQVFEYLLLRAYTDKSQPLGKTVTTRQQIGDMLASNNNTVYKAIKRLEKAKMVTTSATTKYTIFTICNWEKYQANNNSVSNNKVTTKQQRSNSLNKNKDYKTKEVTKVTKQSFGNPDINSLISTFETEIAPLTSRKTMQRYAAARLLKKYPLAELVKVVKAAASVIDKQYAPQILSIEDLEQKLPKLAAYYKRNKPKEMLRV